MPDFHVTLQAWQRANAPALPVHVVRFDSANFQPEQAAALGIGTPSGFAGMVRKRQAEYVHGRLCARAALLHMGAPPGPVGTGPMREPVWPPGVVGSITHCGAVAAAVALPAHAYRGVGIDIEGVAGPESQAALRVTVVSPRESAVLAASGRDDGLALTAVFSAKESFFKASFARVGRYFDFDALELGHVDWDAGTLSFTVTQPLSDELVPGFPVQIAFSLLPQGELTTCYAW